jgi:putative transposase
VVLCPQERRTYFVTAVTANRRRLFQVEQNARLLLDVLSHYRAENRFALHAFVIMPDHIHALLTPASEVSLEKAMQFIKGGFSHRLHSSHPVWERSFNEVQVLNLEKFDAFKKYIEENPVRAGLAATSREYPYSSAHAKWQMDSACPALRI